MHSVLRHPIRCQNDFHLRVILLCSLLLVNPTNYSKFPILYYLLRTKVCGLNYVEY